jgi:hypothetical protein
MVSKELKVTMLKTRLDYFYWKELALLVLTKQISLKKKDRHEETDYSSEDSVLI